MDKIKNEHILSAIKEIEDNPLVRKGRASSTYDLIYNDKVYPPKLVLSLANKYATGKELDANEFEGGLNTPAFNLLSKEGFIVVEKNDSTKFNMLNEYISKLKSGEINAAQSIKSLIKTNNFENNLKVLDRVFFNNELKNINSKNYRKIIEIIKEVHKINAGDYNDFNVWSASKSHLRNVNDDLIIRHDNLNVKVGFPDNGNGLYKSFLGEKNFIAFLLNKFDKNDDIMQILEEKNINKVDNVFYLKAFHENCRTANLKYSPELITRYISSLVTKPFILLSGLSGSGKTKLAQAFAQWICEDKTQFCIVPIGADWTNREPLLGYVNALDESQYILPENGALDLIIEANKPENETKPYFLILDEMNLSHVERYFADFLSVMESKDGFKLHSDKENKKSGVPNELKWTKNLFVVGTVNIDETTYMFSPKVLDRANVIEFKVSEPEITEFLNTPNEIKMELLESKGSAMASDFIKMAKNTEFETLDTEILNKTLINFFAQLQKTGAEFGYRTAMEIHRLYKQISIINPDLKENDKVDIAIMQKLLPKLHGSRRKLSPILEVLGNLCINGIEVKKDFLDNDENLVFRENENVIYPLSLEKITRMYKCAVENGFASYAEA